MKVMVHRMAVAQPLPPHFEVEIDDNATVDELLRILELNYSGFDRHQLVKGDRLREGILILINGRSLHQLGGIDHELKDGDDLLLSVTVCGG